MTCDIGRSNESSETQKVAVVNVAVVSTAEIAKNKVVPALLVAEGCNLVGVSSRSKERAMESVRNNVDPTGLAPNCRAMSNDELFRECEKEEEDVATVIDALYVPLPSRMRNEFLTKALMSGKHVYSEKPAGGTVSEFEAVLNLASLKNLMFMDGTMWYHSNRTKDIERLLFDDGEKKQLGSVRRVSASFSWGGGGLVDEAWIEGGNGRTNPKSEKFGMLGDSGYYPVSVACWAFQWELPASVRATYVEFNTLGAIIEIEATILWENGGRAVVDASCLQPHRSQFEIVTENGVVKVDDLVGGQTRTDPATAGFGAYEKPFKGSRCYTVGDYLGRDVVCESEPCDHATKLVERFCDEVRAVRDTNNASSNPDWSRRALCTHIVLCCIYESAMRGNGAEVRIVNNVDDDSNKRQFIIDGRSYDDLPTMQP